MSTNRTYAPPRHDGFLNLADDFSGQHRSDQIADWTVEAQRQAAALWLEEEGRKGLCYYDSLNDLSGEPEFQAVLAGIRSIDNFEAERALGRLLRDTVVNYCIREMQAFIDEHLTDFQQSNDLYRRADDAYERMRDARAEYDAELHYDIAVGR